MLKFRFDGRITRFKDHCWTWYFCPNMIWQKLRFYGVQRLDRTCNWSFVNKNVQIPQKMFFIVKKPHQSNFFATVSRNPRRKMTNMEYKSTVISRQNLEYAVHFHFHFPLCNVAMLLYNIFSHVNKYWVIKMILAQKYAINENFIMFG